MLINKNNIVWHHATISRLRREQLYGHKSVMLWLTGLSGSGKSTIAHAVEECLHQLGCHTIVMDGDNIRHGLCGDLGFSPEDRTENIRRIGEVGKLFLEAGVIVLTAFISPIQKDRAWARTLVPDGDFIEIYCRCPLEVCEERDVKGLYRKAKSGDVKEFTGISSPYEVPLNPDLILDTHRQTLQECVDAVMTLLKKRKMIKK